MTWPRLGDYQEAIQHPASCFRDKDLKAGTVELSGELPRVMSGNFASVYMISHGQRRWAVRCFSHRVTEQRNRYSHLSSYLPTLRLPYLAEFEYQDEGMLVGGRWYPILKMEWCPGKTLHRYIQEHLDQPSHLLLLSERWQRMVSELQQNGISHGDLQHENVLVSDDHIKLVDYDAMFVPSLAGQASLEPGHENFQHPRRTFRLDFYNERTDDFAALVVYTSLRALSASRSLWAYHNGDNLIFTAKDFLNVSSSIWKGLQSSKNAVVRELAEQLAYFSCVNINQVGKFEKVVNNTCSKLRPPKVFSVRSSVNAINLEYSESFASGNPSENWAKRITLFGSGEIQGMYIEGRLPPVFKEIQSTKPAHEYILVKQGRLCLRTGSELHQRWINDDGTSGRLRLFRVEATKSDIVAVLRRLHDEKIDLLPDEIGVVNTNGRKGSLIYDCLIDGRLIHKEITFFGPSVPELLTERYNECASSVKESLLSIVGAIGREDRWDVPAEKLEEQSITEITEGGPVTEVPNEIVPSVQYTSGPYIFTIPIILTMFSAIGLLAVSTLVDSLTLFYGGGGLLILVSIIVMFRALIALTKRT